jgi:TolB-like protein
MKLKFIFVLALTLIAGAAAAADVSPASVAVYDFTVTSEMRSDFKSKTNGWNASMWNAWHGAIRDFGPKVTALVTADLSGESNLVMVERAELTKALNEQAFGASGMVNSSAAAKIGKMTGAKVLIAGQVFMADEDHLTIIVSIIGTETSRLYAEKVEGSSANLTTLTADLAKKISETISAQYTNLTVVTESHEARIDQIVKAVQGTNRPSVMINVADHLRGGKTSPNPDVTTELGILLQKSGFRVVDEHSTTKADVEVIGTCKSDLGTKQGALFSCRAVVEIKVQERRTGEILSFDRQESEAMEIGKHSAAKAALLNATDGLAERLLPLLAK